MRLELLSEKSALVAHVKASAKAHYYPAYAFVYSQLGKR